MKQNYGYVAYVKRKKSVLWLKTSLKLDEILNYILHIWSSVHLFYFVIENFNLHNSFRKHTSLTRVVSLSTFFRSAMKMRPNLQPYAWS